MKNIVLARYESTAEGTPGVFFFDKLPVAYSLELPWKDNQRNKSCIPAGTYECSWEENRKFPGISVARVHDVKNRTGILIHPFNVITESEGCISVGKSFRNRDEFFLEYSTATIRGLRSLLGGDNFLLQIGWINLNLAPL